MAECSPHGKRVISLLATLRREQDAILKLGGAVFGAPGAPMFPLDFMAFGAVKRSLSTAHAFGLLVESWNMVCARSLLRIHIDTALRFSAAWLVEDPHDFALRVVGGERINKMQDREGERLTDARLVTVRSTDHPWLPAVYENLSGYVHFSAEHIFTSVKAVGAEDRTISFEVSEVDLKFPESSWIEILECFREATSILAKYLQGYMVTKQLSPEELEEARRLLGTKN